MSLNIIEPGSALSLATEIRLSAGAVRNVRAALNEAKERAEKTLQAIYGDKFPGVDRECRGTHLQFHRAVGAVEANLEEAARLLSTIAETVVRSRNWDTRRDDTWSKGAK